MMFCNNKDKIGKKYYKFLINCNNFQKILNNINIPY